MFLCVYWSPKPKKLKVGDYCTGALGVNPTSTAPEMLARIDPHFDSSTQFCSSMSEVISQLEAWKEKYPNSFKFRLLPILPALGFFITDPNSTHGIVKVEIYTSKGWKPIKSRPHIILSRRDSQWREYFIQQWENYWA
jgi:hypothetical protein